MKKKILSVIALMFLVVALSVAAAAVSVTYTIEDTAKDGMYQIVATVSDETGGSWNMYTNNVYYDSTVIIPTLPNGNAANITTGSDAVKKAPLTTYSWKETVLNEETWEEEEKTVKASYTDAFGWTVDGANSVLVFETHSNANPNTGCADGKIVFGMFFKLADGKTLDDVAITVDEILYNNGGEYLYGCEGKNDTDGFEVINTIAPKEEETPDATVTIGGGVAGEEQNVNGIKFSTTFALAEDVTADEVGYLVSSSNNVASADEVTYENTEDLVLKTSKTEFTANLEAFLYASNPEELAGKEDVVVYVRPYIVVNDAVIYGTTQTTTIGAVLEANN